MTHQSWNISPKTYQSFFKVVFDFNPLPSIFIPRSPIKLRLRLSQNSNEQSNSNIAQPPFIIIMYPSHYHELSCVDFHPTLISSFHSISLTRKKKASHSSVWSTVFSPNASPIAFTPSSPIRLLPRLQNMGNSRGKKKSDNVQSYTTYKIYSPLH